MTIPRKARALSFGALAPGAGTPGPMLSQRDRHRRDALILSGGGTDGTIVGTYGEPDPPGFDAVIKFADGTETARRAEPYGVSAEEYKRLVGRQAPSFLRRESSPVPRPASPLTFASRPTSGPGTLTIVSHGQEFTFKLTGREKASTLARRIERIATRTWGVSGNDLPKEKKKGARRR